LWPLLAIGGKLLYATCSIFPQEGKMQAQWFEKIQKDAVRLQAPGQFLPDVVTSEEGRLLDDHDGFYYALFEKCLPH
jgi:16S rRNA (cytosine967-C5)-methyltransferase